jgi:hypothetical protein
MVIAFCSDKGSPGATTSALALAAAWPDPPIVVEADPAGGDLGIRLRPGGSALPEAPTILSLAAASRTDKEPTVVQRHAQRLNPHVSVVPGALRREQMAKVGDWSLVADALRRTQVPVLADLGQLHRASPVLPIAAGAALVVVVGRPDLNSVVRLRDRLAHLGSDLGTVRGTPPKLYALLVSTVRHGAAHAGDLAALLADTAAKPFLVGVGHLAMDGAAVRRLEGGDDPSHRLARTSLMRSARTVVGELQPEIEASTAVASRSAAGSVL